MARDRGAVSTTVSIDERRAPCLRDDYRDGVEYIARLDDRLRDVIVVLRDGDDVRVLDADASVRVLERYREVRHEATRWRLKLGKPGRLLVVDEALCAEISAYLDTNARPG